MSATTAIVWNPSKTEKETLEDALQLVSDEDDPQDVLWFETSKDDPGQGAVARAVDAGAELVIVAGGDGTVRAVAEHLAEVERDIELAIVPLGTGNLLARNLEVPIKDVPAAIRRALTGTAKPVDVGWVEVDLESGTERHGFVVLVGFGIDAQMIAETDEDLKDKAGWLAYVESLGRALSSSDVVPFRITVDDRPETEEEGHTLIIGNCGTLQGGFTLLPDADPTDGELDFLLLSAEGFGEWAGTMKTMLWDNGLMKLLKKTDQTTSTDDMNHGRARRIDVSLPQPTPFEIDGEEIGAATAFRVTVQPAAIRVR